MRRMFSAAVLLAAAAACSPPAEAPPPVEPAAIAPAPAPAPVVDSLTEAEARTRIESAGYTNVTGLTQDTSGVWTATGTQNGASVNVMIDEAGNVTVFATP
jgi:hypothetical protein